MQRNLRLTKTRPLAPPRTGIIPKDSTDQEAVISTFPNRSWFQMPVNGQFTGSFRHHYKLANRGKIDECQN